MPLVHRRIVPKKVSNKKLQLDRTDSEFIAVNNGTLVRVLNQMASLVTIAGEIFTGLTHLTGEVGEKIIIIKGRLEELEIKTELFDPKLIPVPEGSLDWNPNTSLSPEVTVRSTLSCLDSNFFLKSTRPQFLIKLYLEAGEYLPEYGSSIGFLPLPTVTQNVSRTPHQLSPAPIEVQKTDETQKTGENKAVARKKFPEDCLVSVDVTGSIFDRMRANRRSLLVYTKRIRLKKKRRNTICGSVLPNKECGIQTSLHSVTPSSSLDPPPNHSKYSGPDSGHWSPSTEERSPWEPQSSSNSSDFFYDEEDRTLTPQLENFTDGMVSDSDSVDTEGYFTSFRNECGFPKIKRTKSVDDDKKEEDYELFGKGSTSTTASSCGTVIMRKKLELPDSDSSLEKNPQNDELEVRVKRKSLIERVPSLVVVTPSPSCSSASPPPMDGQDLETYPETNREEEELLDQLKRTSNSYSSETISSTETLRDTFPLPLPQPDVIADVYQLTLKGPAKLDSAQEYCSLESPVLLGSSTEEQSRDAITSLMDIDSSTLTKARGARVTLDAHGDIVFSSETLRRKKRHKVSFDPGEAVKTVIYDTLPRDRESVYDRLKKPESSENEKLYECIEEIRRHNLRQSEAQESSCHGDGPCQSSTSRYFLETDLDSAIPPVMPELETLPKIKDCLKRNESYRMATDEVKVTTKSPVVTTSLKSPWKRENRDIPEEDPQFVQQVLSFSHQAQILSPSAIQVTSKFPLTQEDRPSFLRSRDSAPSMEEISKQIYHFRKKFNIEPITLSRNSASPHNPTQPPPPPPRHIRETSFTTPLHPKKFTPTVNSCQDSNFSSKPTAHRRLFSSLKDSNSQTTATTSSKSVSFSNITPVVATASQKIQPKTTSLSHFKRLLSATALKTSPKKTNMVSAMEVLRPRVFGQETNI